MIWRVYATQHDSPSPGQTTPDETIRLTLDYLSCQEETDDILENIFIMGINIESWCSSIQKYMNTKRMV